MSQGRCQNLIIADAELWCNFPHELLVRELSEFHCSAMLEGQRKESGVPLKNYCREPVLLSQVLGF